MLTTSRLQGFRSLSPSERLEAVANAAQLTDNQRRHLSSESTLPVSTADGMIENVVGSFELPLGVATNFLINGRDYLIPMAVEEPSVVAAASFMARIARENGGFITSSTRPIMRGQIQIIDVPDPFGARDRLLSMRDELIELANGRDRVLVEIGGGCQDIEVQIFETSAIGPMVVVHLLVDVRDAMGANAVNTMAEVCAPRIAEIAGGRSRLRILSNLADRRLARARVEIDPKSLATSEVAGEAVVSGIIEACALAEVDPYRAATHNKGIMNGIDPIVVATGNDWRAIEAGAHAWAARSGRYTTLTRWERGRNDTLVGVLELPMALGIVGGATKTHPTAQAALSLLGVSSATELAEVAAAVGLAQNMAALRALATEGIQRGHMALHARNLAIAAGATGDDIDSIAKEMAASGDVTSDHAKRLMKGE
ncbi:MAG: hydroxymethylglutaryl-CoA reductase, degradative [Pseudomonadota bacterium]